MTLEGTSKKLKINSRKGTKTDVTWIIYVLVVSYVVIDLDHFLYSNDLGL